MTEIFYYYGLFYVAKAIYFLFSKEDKEESKAFKKADGIVGDMDNLRNNSRKKNRNINEIEASIKKAEGVLSTTKGMLVKLVSNPRIIFTICDVVWLGAGLFLSAESQLFLFLILSNLSLQIFVAISIIKKRSNLKKANIVQAVVKTIFILIILYKHFYGLH